jgi:hypothetical protein
VTVAVVEDGFADNGVKECFVSAHADDDLSAASARRAGKRACVAKPSFTSKATPASMACGCPQGLTLLRHGWNSRLANVQSLKQPAA